MQATALLISALMTANLFGFYEVRGAVLVAKPASSVVFVNGAVKTFAAYNIGGSNYFKLRDLAYAVNGTEKQFNIVWDEQANAIKLISGQAYEAAGGELSAPEDFSDKGAASTNTVVMLNGKAADFTVYNIEGSHYFKLRDVMEAFNIGVDYNQVENAIEIDTKSNYALLPEDKDKDLNAQQIYAKCSSAIFYIETYDMNHNPLYSGSGFFTSADGRAVTNYHVLEDAFYAQIILPDNTKYDVKGVRGYDIEKDVALLQIDGMDFSYLNMGTSANITGGEHIYTIGSPKGLSNTITEGIVSNPNRNADGVRLIQISAPISSGSSGGALLNTKGEVIGITSSAIADAQNINFAVAVEEMKKVAERETIAQLSQVAAERDKYIFEKIPEPFKAVATEKEPNNTYEQAMSIPNGITIQGVIDNIYLDNYSIRCNTPGVIDIYCTSDSPYFEDLAMIVDNLEENAPAGGKFYTLEDGTKFLCISYKVEKPDIYFLSILSGTGLKDIEENIPYIFYYQFTPNGAEKKDSMKVVMQ